MANRNKLRGVVSGVQEDFCLDSSVQKWGEFKSWGGPTGMEGGERVRSTACLRSAAVEEGVKAGQDWGEGQC